MSKQKIEENEAVKQEAPEKEELEKEKFKAIRKIRETLDQKGLAENVLELINANLSYAEESMLVSLIANRLAQHGIETNLVSVKSALNHLLRKGLIEKVTRAKEGTVGFKLTKKKGA